MKGTLKILAILLLLSMALIYVIREPFKETAPADVNQDMFVEGDTDDFDPGPAVGSQFPGLQAIYQGRTVKLLNEFSGKNGTVFIASRSYDWCPYCKHQMIQLQETKAAYDAAGIGMVAITYDDPALQKLFADQFNITIPVLSDIDALSFKTLGILNEEYMAGESQYGIPHPGMIVVDPQGAVVGKLFLEAFSSRVDSTAALAFASSALGLDPVQ
ncbi:MAG: redoxin domain-containing protein [Halioglobus sp.]|nr:redoxin domain-containing protein [Halioglobus sp.]